MSDIGAGRDRYGDQALRAFAAGLAPASATVSAIIALLDGFGDGLDDDIAVLALGVPPLPAGSAPADCSS